VIVAGIDHGPWRFDLPITRPISLNGRYGHWAAQRRDSNTLKAAVVVLARNACIPHLDRFTAELHYEPRDNRRRDVDNLVPTLKHVVDGLVLAGVADDDDHTRYVLSSPVIHSAARKSRLWVVVVDLGRDQADFPNGRPV
jgi:crossover junction endodeoxyribonuclease RusA